MGLISRFPTPQPPASSMEFYPPAVKQEPNSSPLNPLVIDENGHRKWENEDVDDAEYSPQLMDLSTKKQQQQQVNNNYFFGTPLFPHQQDCYFDYPPPHPEFYPHVQDFDTPMHHDDDDLDETSSQVVRINNTLKFIFCIKKYINEKQAPNYSFCNLLDQDL